MNNIENSDIEQFPRNSDSNDDLTLIFEETWGGGSSDKAFGIAYDSIREYVFMAGLTNSFGSGGDAAIICYDTSDLVPILLWNITWGGPSYDCGIDLVYDDDTELLYITGETRSAPLTGNGDVFLLCYNTSSDVIPLPTLLWATQWGISGRYALGTDIALEKTTHKIYICGKVVDDGLTSYDSVLLRYDVSGTSPSKDWHITYGEAGSDDYGLAIAINTTNVFVTGSTASYAIFESDAFLLNYDVSASGTTLPTLLWDDILEGWEGRDIQLNSDASKIIVCGTLGKTSGERAMAFEITDVEPINIWNITNPTNSFGPFAASLDFEMINFCYSIAGGGIITAQYSMNGSSPIERWTRIDGTSVNDDGNSIVLDETRNRLFIAGGFQGSSIDMWLVCVNLTAYQDLDDDLLLNYEEIIYNTDENDPDSDNDGLSDYEEVKIHSSDPNIYDTDEDGLSDFLDVDIGCSPLNNDSDNDQMPDGWEYTYSLDPTNNSDRNLDFDSDGLTNYEEFTMDLNPTSNDTDSDLMTDKWEIDHLFDPTNSTDGILDRDDDGLSNAGEYLNGTNPDYWDSDGDQMPDGWEVFYNLDPNSFKDAIEDPDGDERINLIEYQQGTNPLVADDSESSGTSEDSGKIGALITTVENFLQENLVWTVLSLAGLTLIYPLLFKLKRKSKVN